ncbi:MAG: ABC transporter substrate-binding protein [Candidatus Competibacteraceae bacterium]|nr:ABC transporter substrate-binding protein [Candidatus Competibacteraceae bacterium]
MTSSLPIIPLKRCILSILHRVILGLFCVFILASATLAEEQSTTPPTRNQTRDCLERYDPTIDYFPEKATLTYAKGFTLEYFKHYKVITVTTPWPAAKESFRYVLVQCGAPTPAGFTDAQVIPIPVRSIAVLSTTHLPHLEMLNALDRLVAVGSYQNVYSPAVRQWIAAGKVAQVGRGPGINLEMILDLRPDLVTAVGHDQPQYNTHPLLRHAGVNVAINSEYVEPTLLGSSEWLKFTAAFLNRDGLAQRRFAEMAERYEALAAQVRDGPAVEKPSVFSGFLDRDVWYVPSGGSSIARLIADAGGRYLWANDAHRGSLPLSFEVVFERAGDADVWLASDLDWFTRADLLAANARYGAFKAFRNRRVYNQNARLNENKANDYWEAGIVEPDVVLADVIKILHPDRLPDHRLKYYRWLP